jgi:hypothetical protein
MTRRSGILTGASFGLVLALACRVETDARAEYLRAVTAAEAPLEAALRRLDRAFEGSDRSAAREAAREALAAATIARDSLEALRVPPTLAAALREELLFLNHVIPACRSFAAGDGGAAEIEKLRSILRRGRLHQRRGRDALR